MVSFSLISMILGSWLRRYPFSAAFFRWVILKTDRDSCDLYEFGISSKLCQRSSIERNSYLLMRILIQVLKDTRENQARIKAADNIVIFPRKNGQG